MDVRARLEEVLPKRYRIERELAHGGMAVVYLAQDLQVPHKVAIKVLSPELALAVKRERFLNEIETVSRLTHPHIVSVFDSGGQRDCLYYVMEYVEGETVADRIARSGPLPVAEALGIARVVADALAYAHEQGVIHRDIKPGNILLSASGHAWVADFGIAKAVGTSGDANVTATGVQLGTPAYMSPEQLTTGAVLDGRTDIYSLGCVLFEMLTGRPPFVGPSLQSIMTQHLTDPPPAVRSLRRDVSSGVQRIVARALAKQPAARFLTAIQLRDAIDVGDVEQSGVAAVVEGLRRYRVAGVAVVTAASLTIGVITRSNSDARSMDPGLHVVAAFGHRSGAAPRLLSGDYCESLLYEAVRRWEDVRLVDFMRVRDALARKGLVGGTLDEAVAVARSLRSGRLLWGEVGQWGDTVEVRAALYDVAADSVIREHIVRLQPGLADMRVRFAELADSLLVGRPPPGLAATSLSGTKRLQAVLAHHRGLTALRNWDFRTADSAFGAAVIADPAYGQASFWLAQVRVWAGKPVELWAVAAKRAAAAGLTNARERALASALGALADRQFPQACAAYDSLLQADSADYSAWFGRGECHRQDKVVVRDSRSATGWRWRSSLEASATAYERALDVVPSAAFAFPPLARFADVVFIEPHTLRFGIAAPPDSGAFLGYLSLSNDTAAFIPIPLDAFSKAPEPGTLDTAVAINRRRLERIVRRWARQFPDSSLPNRQLARVLELSGALEGSGGVEASGVLAARRAVETAHSTSDSVDAAVIEIRLLMKTGQFAAASNRARETLTRVRNPSSEEARSLAALAALIGEVHTSVRLAVAGVQDVKSYSIFADVPLALLEAATALSVYAAAEVPAESIRTVSARLDTLLRTHVAPQRVGKLRCGVLLKALALAAIFTQHAPTGPDCPSIPLLDLDVALLSGNPGAVHDTFQHWVNERRGILPGDISTDHIYGEVRLLLAAADTVAAVGHAERHLAALRALRHTVLSSEPSETVGLVRLMALRAELADRAGDRVTARRWAMAVRTLWSQPDPALDSLVKRMEVVARGR